MSQPIVEIWRFVDAPPELQNLSTNGGDEDYIVIVRDNDFDGGKYQDEDGEQYERGMGWLPFENGFLSRWFWSRYEHDRLIVWIGAHA